MQGELRMLLRVLVVTGGEDLFRAISKRALLAYLPSTEKPSSTLPGIPLPE